MKRTIKIGFHRNSPRLWIEGNILRIAGFSYGDKWRIVARTDTDNEQAREFFLVAADQPMPFTTDTVCGGSVSHRFRNGKETLIVDTHNKAFQVGSVTIEADALENYTDKGADQWWRTYNADGGLTDDRFIHISPA